MENTVCDKTFLKIVDTHHGSEEDYCYNTGNYFVHEISQPCNVDLLVSHVVVQKS